MEYGFISEKLTVLGGLKPDADGLAGTKTTDVVNLGLAQKALFAVQRGAGSTGTQTLTLQASAANDGASPEAVPFKYRRIDITADPADEMSDFSDVTTAGFTTAAGGDDIYLIEVKAESLPEDKPYLHLKSVEGVDAAVDASVLILLDGVKYLGVNRPSVV